MSYISSGADVSVFLQVIEQMNPSDASALNLMSEIHNNQLQLSTLVGEIQLLASVTKGDTQELAESVATNAQAHLLLIKNQLEGLV